MRCGGGGRGFFQAEDGIRDVERSRGLGDVYKRQLLELIVIIPLEAVFLVILILETPLLLIILTLK